MFCILPSADNLGPVVVYCPPDQQITATEMNTLVTWNEPQFQDNSNDPLVIDCNYQSGTEFYWGTYGVNCRAYDNNPNNDPAVCQFKIIVKRKSLVNCLISRLFARMQSQELKKKTYFFTRERPFYHR